MTVKKKVYYAHLGPFPLYLGVAFTEKAFRDEVKRLGISIQNLPFVNAGAGATTHFFQSQEGMRTCLIAFDAAKAIEEKRKPNEVIGLFVHECVHAWQECLLAMGEKDAGSETEAYFIQYATQFCLDRFDDFKKGGRK